MHCPLNAFRGPYATFYPRFHMYALWVHFNHTAHLSYSYCFFVVVHSEKCTAHGYNGMNTRMAISHIFSMLNTRFVRTLQFEQCALCESTCSISMNFEYYAFALCIYLEAPLAHCLVPVMNYIIESTRKLANGTAQCKNKPILINVHGFRKKYTTTLG